MTPAAVNGAAPVATAPPAQRAQRVLARFELACPALRDFQVAVQLLGPRTELVMLPAAGRPKGRVEFVFTPRGRLRTCLAPAGLTSVQAAAVEDLAWAIYEALAAREGPAKPAN